MKFIIDIHMLVTKAPILTATGFTLAVLVGMGLAWLVTG